MRFLPTGRLDKSFGNGGLLRIDTIAGGEFRLADLAVDRLGRAVLGGDAGAPEHAVVIRLTVDGSLDPTFGGGLGVTSPKFGIPQMRLSPTSGEPSHESPFYLRSLDIDPDGRIVVAGSAVRFAGGYCLAITSGVVGRLTLSGAVDTSFDGGGPVVYAPEVIDSVPGFALSQSGAPILWGAGEECHGTSTGGWQIARLSLNGQTDPAFGEKGQVALRERPADVAIDRLGRMLVLESGSIRRLLPSGHLDERFGNHGTAKLRLSGRWSAFADLAAAPSGDVFAAGVQVRHENSAKASRRLALASLTPRGRPLIGFGPQGTETLRSSVGGESAGRRVMVDNDGRAIVAGTFTSRQPPNSQGLVLYRFKATGR